MAGLDDAYANAAHIPGADAYPDRWAAQAATFRDRLAGEGRARLSLRYGDSDRQGYDLFLPRETARGLVIFVHGGYWLRFDRSFWSHLATGALRRGWACAMPGYDLCPDVRIADITAQIAKAVPVMATEVPGPLTLTGHSAGGHLVARMMAPGMLPEAVASRIAHVAPISPVADLRPLLRTSMNDQFRMDLAAAEAESPVLQPVPEVPVTVWVGEDERPAFLDQAKQLSDAWGCVRVVAPGKHHFDVIDALAEPESDLVRTLTP